MKKIITQKQNKDYIKQIDHLENIKSNRTIEEQKKQALIEKIENDSLRYKLLQFLIF